MGQGAGAPLLPVSGSLELDQAEVQHRACHDKAVAAWLLKDTGSWWISRGTAIVSLVAVGTLAAALTSRDPAAALGAVGILGGMVQTGLEVNKHLASGGRRARVAAAVVVAALSGLFAGLGGEGVLEVSPAGSPGSAVASYSPSPMPSVRPVPSGSVSQSARPSASASSPSSSSTSTTTQTPTGSITTTITVSVSASGSVTRTTTVTTTATASSSTSSSSSRSASSSASVTTTTTVSVSRSASPSASASASAPHSASYTMSSTTTRTPTGTATSSSSWTPTPTAYPIPTVTPGAINLPQGGEISLNPKIQITNPGVVPDSLSILVSDPTALISVSAPNAAYSNGKLTFNSGVSWTDLIDMFSQGQVTVIGNPTANLGEQVLFALQVVNKPGDVPASYPIDTVTIVEPSRRLSLEVGPFTARGLDPAAPAQEASGLRAR